MAEVNLLRRTVRLPWRWVRIVWYKHKGRRAYYTMEAIADSYDCGSDLLEMVSPRYAKASHELHHCIEKLEELSKEHSVPSVV